MTVQEFLQSEARSHNVIVIKKSYIDLAGDVVCGMLLSQIVYWFTPSQGSETPKARIQRDGRLWIAKAREDWHEECRISVDQFDRCIGALEKKGFVVTGVFRFNGNPTKHISVNFEQIIKALKDLEVPPDGDNSRSSENSSSVPRTPPESIVDKPKGSYRETTTQTTAVLTSDLFQEEAEKKQPPKSNSEKSTKHQSFKLRWIESYQNVFQENYRFDGAKDAQAIHRMLGWDDEDKLFRVIETAWKNYREGAYGSYDACLTIAGISTGWNKFAIHAKDGIPQRQSQFHNVHNRKEITDEQHARGW